MVAFGFCVNSTIWNNGGLSECFQTTVQSGVVFFLSVVAKLYHQYQRSKETKQTKLSISLDSQEKSLIEDVALEDQKKRFKDFPFPKLPLPFLFFSQLFLSFLLTIIPIIQLVLKMILDIDKLSGVQVMSSTLNFLTWALGLNTLKRERDFHFKKKKKSHSPLLILFWAIALLFDLLFFSTWNEKNSFLRKAKDNTSKMETTCFAFRLAAKLIMFFLGFHAPGLQQPEDTPTLVDKSGRSWSLKDVWEKLKKLWPFIWPKNNWVRQRVVICFGLMVLGCILNVLVPVFIKKIVDYLTNKSNVEHPWRLVSVYIVFQFLQGFGGGSVGVLNHLRLSLWIKIQHFTRHSVQTEMLEHLHNLSLRWHAERKTSEVIKIVNKGAASIDHLLSSLSFRMIPIIIDITAALLFFGTVFNGWFSLIVFTTLALYIVVTIVINEWRINYRQIMDEKGDAAKEGAIESLTNYETVKFYNNEEFEVNRYSEKIRDHQGAHWMAHLSLALLNIIQNIVLGLGFLSGMLYCGVLVVQGKLTVGDFVLFFVYLRQLYTPLGSTGNYYRLVREAFVDLENLFNLVEQEIEISDRNNADVMTTNHGLVEFKDVLFRYDETKPMLLKGITFTVLPGTTIALVGRPGSGKSIILYLLFRLYDVTGGHILIDGQDIRQVTQKSLRQRIGVVRQETVLFNDTIRYNISYGDVGSSDRKIKDAAVLSDLHKKITTFDEEYGTVVGELGRELSGGETQLVALARTLLKEPDIFLLDMATSALDTQTERTIQESLNRVSANKTTIVVAHRLSTVIEADQIIVLDDGVIVEKGRHLELLEEEGLYHSMWHEQLSKAEESD